MNGMKQVVKLRPGISRGNMNKEQQLEVSKLVITGDLVEIEIIYDALSGRRDILYFPRGTVIGVKEEDVYAY